MKFTTCLVTIVISFSLSACDNSLGDPKTEKVYKSCLVDFKNFTSSPGKQFNAGGLDKFCKCFASSLVKNIDSSTTEDEIRAEIEVCRIKVLK